MGVGVTQNAMIDSKTSTAPQPAATTQARQQSQKITSTAIGLLKLGFTPKQVLYCVNQQRAKARKAVAK